MPSARPGRAEGSLPSPGTTPFPGRKFCHRSARAPLLICGGGRTLERTLRGGRSARGAKGARRGHGASARETGAVTTTTNGLRVAPGHRRRATGSSWGRRLPPLWPPWRNKGSVPPAAAPLSPSPRDRGHGARDAAAPADTALRARGCHLSVGTSPGTQTRGPGRGPRCPRAGCTEPPG